MHGDRSQPEGLAPATLFDDAASLALRARRAVTGQPVDCLTMDEIIDLRHRAQEWPNGGMKPGDYRENDLARSVAKLASKRREDRVRAALDSLAEELAAAFTIAEVERLLDIAFGAVG